MKALKATRRIGRYALSMAGLCAALWSCVSHAAIVGTYEGSFEPAGTTLTISLRCQTEAYCELESRSPGDRNASAPLIRYPTSASSDLRGLRAALQFARDRKATPAPNEEVRAIRQTLTPLLDSNADLSRCIKLMLGNEICELDSSPWNKPVVIYFGTDLANCRPQSIFCGYVLFPLFQTAKTATMRATMDAFVPAKFSLPPVAPEIKDYVAAVQGKVQSLLMVPPGTRPDTSLIVQVQFNQELGSRYSVNIMNSDDCDCAAFKRAAIAAVEAAWPIPLLPKEKWQFLEGRNAKLYMVLRASP